MKLGQASKIEEVEEEIEKLESIVSCKIMHSEGKFNEVHIVSNKIRSAKQLVRDINSLLIATYNIQIDHKVISIAEIPCKDLEKKERRLKIYSVAHDNNNGKAYIKISLQRGGEIFTKTNQGINARRNIDRMLVDTTLKAVEEACGYQDAFALEDIKTVNLTTAEAVVVLVGTYNRIEQRFSGTSLVGQDYKKAVVKATLDAINRHLVK